MEHPTDAIIIIEKILLLPSIEFGMFVWKYMFTQKEGKHESDIIALI